MDARRSSRDRSLHDASTAPLPDLARSLELARRVRQGDAAALDDLLARYQERLLRIIRVRLGPRLRRRVEPADVLQDVMLRASGAIAGFEPRSHAAILGWLSVIAEHRIRELHKRHTADKRDLDREAAWPASGSGEHAGPDPRLAASQTSPSERVARRELERIVDEQLAELAPERYRRVIELRDYHGASWEEVRAGLGDASVKSAQSMYARARARLEAAVARRLGL